MTFADKRFLFWILGAQTLRAWVPLDKIAQLGLGRRKTSLWFLKAAAETADFLRPIGQSPQTGLLTGTGLSEATEALRVSTAFEYTDIPHFPVSTVQSHAGRLLCGDLAGRPVMVMQGRFHLYEGYLPAEVAFPIRVMQELGLRRLVVTNAAGGLNPAYAPGDMMLITDHINLTGKAPGRANETAGDRVSR
jgi:purine nucleoside phosphorylase